MNNTVRAVKLPAVILGTMRTPKFDGTRHFPSFAKDLSKFMDERVVLRIVHQPEAR